MKKMLLASIAATLLSGFAGSIYAAGFTVQGINSPGPAIRMNGNGAVAGCNDTSGNFYTFVLHPYPLRKL